MVDWKITATTMYCDAVADEVTIIVFRDFSVRCTGYQRYGEPSKGVTNRLKKKRHPTPKLACQGLQCPRVTQYKEKLFTEEVRKGHIIEPAKK